MTDQSNGFRFKSWSDVLAFLGIVALLFSALLWATMLQLGKEDHERRITRLEEQVRR